MAAARASILPTPSEIAEGISQQGPDSSSPDRGPHGGPARSTTSEGTPTWDAEQREAKYRELFDTANRVIFFKFIQEDKLDPNVAMQTFESVREVYFQHVESGWNSYREELHSRTETEIADALVFLKAEEMLLGIDVPKTLKDRVQAGGLLLGADTRMPEHGDGPPPIRYATRNLVEAMMLDVWPRHTAIVDFGIDSERHYEALQFPIRNGELTVEVLDAALGFGQRLTELVRAAPSNPHKDIEFRTSWDELRMGPEGLAAAADDSRLPSPGRIADEGLARDSGSPEPERGPVKNRGR
jgi:hypothetical protein